MCTVQVATTIELARQSFVLQIARPSRCGGRGNGGNNPSLQPFTVLSL